MRVDLRLQGVISLLRLLSCSATTSSISFRICSAMDRIALPKCWISYDPLMLIWAPKFPFSNSLTELSKDLMGFAILWERNIFTEIKRKMAKQTKNIGKHLELAIVVS